MKNKEYTTVHGFEVPKSMPLNPKTREVLKQLKKHGSCLWERDDSPDGYRVSKQLKEIAGNVGLYCFGNSRGNVNDMGSAQTPNDYQLLLVCDWKMGKVS